MQRIHFRTGIVSGLLSFIMIFSGNSVIAGPGTDNGTIPDPNNPIDAYFQAGYSYVYSHSDVDSDTWMSGAELWEIYYQDLVADQNDDYDLFFKEITIPWVRITWLDQVTHNTFVEIYPHDDIESVGGSMNKQLRLYQSTEYFYEGNALNPPPNGGTDFYAEYGLDMDNSNQADFRFIEYFSLDNGNIAANGGTVTLRIGVSQNPQNWRVVMNNHQCSVQYIEFAFLIDPDVYDTTNGVLAWNVITQQWNQKYLETGPVAIPLDQQGNPVPCVRVVDSGHEVRIVPGQAASSGYYWCIEYNDDGEYSQYPTDYVNGETINNADAVVWYVAGYDVANNVFPPNPQNGFVSVRADGLTA